MSLQGHFWTIAPNLWHTWRPLSAPPFEPWKTTLRDPEVGDIPLHGYWQSAPEQDTALVVVHGMGGGADRHYCIRAARAAARRGWGCLRIGLRGADRSGVDLHHAGLHEDIGAAVDSPTLQGYRRIFLLGYSLGGHTVLRHLSADPDPRIAGGAAVCSPLDLDRAAAHIDANHSTYRRHLLAGLIEIYEAVSRRRELPASAESVRSVRTVREFDALAVAGRFGFRSAEDYYERESASNHLEDLKTPALFVASTRDPILPPSVLRPVIETAPERFDARWIPGGGHVNFPAKVDLGDGAPARLEDQILAELEKM